MFGKIKNNYYPELESLRGICALLVVIWHLFSFGRCFNFNYFVSKLNLFWYEASEYAVTMFFILSGFVIIENLENIYKSYTKVYKQLIVYYLTRALRLLLPIGSTLLFSFFLFTFFGYQESWPRYNDFSINNILLNLIVLKTNLNPPGWTLKYEVAFYILIPFVFAFIKTNSIIMKIIFTLLFLGFLLLLALLIQNYILDFSEDLAFTFVTGILVNKLHKRVPLIPHKKSFILVIIIALLFLIVIKAIQPAHYTYPLQSSCLLGCLLYSILVFKPIFMKNIILVHLGKISFSLYLLHYPIFWIISDKIEDIEILNIHNFCLLVFLTMPLIFFVSLVNYYLIEHLAYKKIKSFIYIFFSDRISKSKISDEPGTPFQIKLT